MGERPRLGIIDDGGSWVRPTTDELEGILERIDCPEHGGKMHFLEVLLSLLQNVTGVVSEEQIMSDLLKNRPGYWESLRGMPKISGFSGDEKIKARIMAKLRDAIHKSGLASGQRARTDAPSAGVCRGRGRAAQAAAWASR